MNKHVLLCALVVSAPALAECDRDCKGRELAAEVVKATVRAADDADVRSCSKCSGCSSCGKCSCKSENTDSEDAETRCNCGKPKPRTVRAADTEEDAAETKSCGKCCSSCGTCSCKSEGAEEEAAADEASADEEAAE